MEGEGGDRAAEQGRASSSPLKPNTAQVANPYYEATFASTSHHIKIKKYAASTSHQSTKYKHAAAPICRLSPNVIDPHLIQGNMKTKTQKYTSQTRRRRSCWASSAVRREGGLNPRRYSTFLRRAKLSFSGENAL